MTDLKNSKIGERYGDGEVELWTCQKVIGFNQPHQFYREAGSSRIYYVSNNDPSTSKGMNRTQAEKVMDLRCPACPE